LSAFFCQENAAARADSHCETALRIPMAVLPGGDRLDPDGDGDHDCGHAVPAGLASRVRDERSST
jgi:hypothetical protein